MLNIEAAKRTHNGSVTTVTFTWNHHLYEVWVYATELKIWDMNYKEVKDPTFRHILVEWLLTDA